MVHLQPCPARRASLSLCQLLARLVLLALPLAAADCGGTKNPTAASRSYTLSVSASPSGGGALMKSPDQAQFTSGTAVTVTAVPTSGYQFKGWQGDASGSTNPLTVTMDRNKSVVAEFSRPTQYTVTAASAPTNGGEITRAPDQAQYAAGTTVTLTAVPAEGYRFVGWRGDASGSTNPVTLTLDANKSVTAEFVATAGPQYTLTVATTPAGGGTLTKSPDQGQYAAGTTVTVTATPAAGFQFADWQGDASGLTNAVTITMDRNKSVTARFSTVAQYALATAASPSNGGTVTKAPDQPQYLAGIVVTLTAAPAAGYQFTGWQGDASGSTNPLPLTMNGNKSVTALFAAIPAPTVTAPASVTGSAYNVSVMYQWGSIPLSANDSLELEESSGNSAFTTIGRSTGGDRTTPWIVSLTRSSGTYTYRARARLGALAAYSPYSSNASTVVQNPVSKTRFLNDTQDTYEILSLQIDGAERLPGGQLILAGSAREIEMTPGAHTYVTVHGFSDANGRHDVYTRSGNYTQPVGTVYTVNVPGRTLADLLTTYYWKGLCNAEGGNYQGYRFYAGGSFEWYIDDIRQGPGYWKFVSQNTTEHTVWFRALRSSGATLYVNEQYFTEDCPGMADLARYEGWWSFPASQIKR